MGKEKMGKGGKGYGDKWKLEFWWWAHYRVYIYWIVMLYTWNLYDYANQYYHLNYKSKTKFLI